MGSPFILQDHLRGKENNQRYQASGSVEEISNNQLMYVAKNNTYLFQIVFQFFS